jgi:3-oxocholest-4-en-26-oyl-CoA dehydrogenase alpha subunit
MHLEYTPEQKDLRKQLRLYFRDLFSEELYAELDSTEGGGPLYTKALQQMGKDGWLGLGWPEEFGGQNRSAIDQFIFSDEVQRAFFPIPLLTLNTVGPTIMAHGTKEQKDFFLPKITEGKVHFSIGYTEPSAGTDLASLKTKAEPDGDDFIVNGQKIFTSQAHYCDYIWLACRTDPDAAKHKGISILMVDKNLPGVQFTPTQALGENKVFTTYLENVRVPQSMVVGGLNNGWKLITSQLNHERVALFPVGLLERFFEETRAWAKETPAPEGGLVLERPWVKTNLAEVYRGLDILRLFNWRQAWNIEQGALPPQEASAVKVFGSEFYVKANQLLMEILGSAGPLHADSQAVQLQGRLEKYYRSTLVLTFGGGANEIQRDIISMAGLRMPRPPR